MAANPDFQDYLLIKRKQAIVAALEPPAVPKKRRRSRLRLLSRIEED